MRIKLSVSILFALVINLLTANNNYPVFSIPDSLKQNANAIVRDYLVEFTQTSKTNATVKIKEVVTIMNKDGESAAHFIFEGGRLMELSGFSGVVRDALGNEVKKIKKGDLTESNVNLFEMNTLTTDHYNLYFAYKHPTYPYTIEYNYEMKWKNGLISYYPFLPVPNHSLSVERASYILKIPSEYEMRYKSNYNIDISESKDDKFKTYQTQLSAIKAIEQEPYSPSYALPFALFAPSEFCYDSFCGDMKDWKNYGKWVNDLKKGQDNLSPEMKAQFLELVKDVKNDREKVKILYEYLQNNTRYINIAMGIGGYKPIDAQSTLKNRFGDCKGLTNLMKAILNAVGIESYYSLIISDEKKKYFFKEFPNFQQLNHVILLVPIQNDSIWLECTSSSVPFGFVHQDIAGHDALVISEEGGKISRLPAYKDTQNLSESFVTIYLNESGDAEGEAQFTKHLFEYDRRSYVFNSNDRDEHVKFLNSLLKLSKAQYGNIGTSVNESELPWGKITTDFKTVNFANKTGDRLFIPVYPLAAMEANVFKSSKRNMDIYFSTGFYEKDSLIFVLPEGYTPESLPKDISLKSDLGSFDAKVRHEDNKIIYEQSWIFHNGTYSKEKYEDIKQFIGKIVAATKKKIVVKKVS